MTLDSYSLLLNGNFPGQTKKWVLSEGPANKKWMTWRSNQYEEDDNSSKVEI